ncbi:MAG: S1-C subfamily serine protease [Candidatus Azotimanducaceae bacterium]|jgi:S1-C subfamily serine protease
MKQITIRCSSCQEKITLPAQAKGMRIRCPSCKQELILNAPLPPKPPVRPQMPEPKDKDRARRFPTWFIPALITANIVLIALTFLVARGPNQSTPSGDSIPLISNAVRPNLSTERDGVPAPPSSDSTAVELTVEDIYKRYAPATVSIVTDENQNEHLGSGFFVSSDGHLLTNFHVVENARSIYVYTQGGARLRAEIADTWPTMDLALLDVEGEGYSVIPLGDSDSVSIGSSVVAIGTPQDIGLAQSITQGIISGRRKIDDLPCFQTSALINHGNSGGPLLNMRGQAVAIATFVMGTALVTPEGNIGSDIQGINFALEINLAKTILTRNGIQHL